MKWKRMLMEVVNFHESTATGAKNGKVQRSCWLSFDRTDCIAVFSLDDEVKKLEKLQKWAGVSDMLGLLGKSFMVVIRDGQIIGIGNEDDEFIKVNGRDCRTYALSEL